MAEMKKITIDLGENSYDIIIGYDLAAEMTAFISKQKYSAKGIIITDTNVGSLYGEAMKKLIAKAGIECDIFNVEAGESAKSLAVAEKIYTRVIELGLDRRSPVFALGGGVVGDLAGFIAATYMRGVPFIQLPTSLLAQVDSSVGGKVAVNHKLGKNLIGAFYQPDAVFMDLNLLKTLPKREISTGLGEVVKYGLIYDKEFFAYLKENEQEILSLSSKAIPHIIARSCEIKAAVVSADEKEQGLRRILNFGHTLAHAIEQETNYSRYNHGEAVAIGMVGAAYISKELNLIDENIYAEIISLLESLNLPVKAEDCHEDHLYKGIFSDKKTVGGKVNWVLIDAIGSTIIKNDVAEEIVRKAIKEILA